MNKRITLLVATLLLLTGCDFIPKIVARRLVYTVQEINATPDTMYYSSYFHRMGDPFIVAPSIFIPIPPGDSSQQSVLDRSELYSHPERYRYYIWFASRETYWKNESLWPANYGKPSLYDTVLSYTIEELKAMNYRVVYRGKPVTP